MNSTLWTDVLFTLRTLRRSPVFTTVALGSLALGLGSNTAIFTLMDQILLRPLPVKDPAAVVQLSAPGANFGWIRGDESSFSYPMYEDLRDKTDVFTGVAARFPVLLNLQTGAQADPVRGELVSGNYFDVLGVAAAAGRTLTPDDDRRDAEAPAVMIGHDLWIRRFGGDPSIVGKDIRINARPMTVVGVVEPRFFGLEIGRRAEIYVPMSMKTTVTPTWDDMKERRSMWLNIFARLKPGVSRERAFAAIQPLHRALLAEEANQMSMRPPERFLQQFKARALKVEEGAKGVTGLRTTAGKPLIVLMGMVGLVLLIACANVANLLMARAAARRKEIAVRLAMGASRLQIVRQLLVESALLSAAGGLLGLIVASWTVDLVMALLPETLRQGALNTSLDGRVLAFSFLLSLATGVVFGLAPALQSVRPDLASTLKDQAASVVGGWRGLKSRKMLVVAQVALSLLLLVGSGLFVRSLKNLRSLDPGFNTSSLVSFEVDAALAGYPPERVRQIFDSMESGLHALPGVTAVTAAQTTLLSADAGFATVSVQGYEKKQGDNMNPGINQVGAGFFKAMSLPLLQGREFSKADAFGSASVAIVNESFARQFFAGQSPLGRRFGMGHDSDTFEIVGVVGDSKSGSLRERTTKQFFLPWRQEERPGTLTFYVRTGFEPENAFASIRNQVTTLAPGLAIYNMKTVERQVDESLMNERLVATLCSLFGALATLLAAIGLYGVMAYSVARRTREIGIRVALGAGREKVLGMVLREVGLLALAGVGTGLPTAIWLSSLIESQLFGLKPNDPLTLAGATALIVIVALVAGAVPARRAARVDPLTALRYE